MRNLLRASLLFVTAVLLVLPALAATDAEAAEKKGVKPPAEWVFPAARPLRVLTVRGLWYEMFAVERALSRLGGAYIEKSWQSPGDLRCYPEGYEGLIAHHLVVVCNTNGGAYGPVRRKMLRDYVEQGGAVLFLGGWYAYGKEYRGTAFEEICPVTFADARDVTSAGAQGAVLAPGKDVIGAGWGKLPWTAQPRVFWYHAVTPKPNAKVLLTAGDKPLLITGTFGKGRVAVFTGSVMGDPQAGQLPFWTWDCWPVVLADTIKWLSETGRPDSVLSADGRQQLATQLLGQGVKKPSVMGPIIAKKARICGDKDTAKLLLEGVNALEGEAPLDLVDTVGDGVRAFADASLVEAAQALLESGRMNKTSLGLRMLGQSKATGARAILEGYLKSGEVSAEGEDPMDLEGSGEIIEDPKNMAYAIRLGALEGLGNLGDPAAQPAIRTYLKGYEKTKSKPENFPYLVTQEDELYQEAALAALRCGDAQAAGPVVDALLENQYVFVRMLSILDAPQYENDIAMRTQKAQVGRAFSRAHERQAQLYKKLASLSDSVLPALAKRLAVEEDPRAIPIAYAAFGKAFLGDRKLPKEALDTLKTSKLQAIADLGQ